jgi:hypothetical protein
MTRLSRSLLAAGTALALPLAAHAVPLTLQQAASHTIGPQSASNPCIIAATNCQQPASMGFNNFKEDGNIPSYNMYSTTPKAQVDDGVQGTPYTVAQLDAAMGSDTFDVAIDVNTASGGETLELFEVIVNGAVAFDFVGPHLIGDVSNNGNGFADWTLSTVDLSSFKATDTVLFHAVWDHADDGGESFFLVGATPAPPVPEPAAAATLGIGVLGLLAVRRRRRPGSSLPA